MTEAKMLEKRLRFAIANQKHLVLWRWLLSAVTFALDYAGAVLNFVCVALPVATGKSSTFVDHNSHKSSRLIPQIFKQDTVLTVKKL